MEIPLFFSYAKPFNRKQKKFIDKVEAHLVENGFKPRTLGITDYSPSAPLMKIREIMNVMGCYQLHLDEALSKKESVNPILI